MVFRFLNEVLFAVVEQSDPRLKRSTFLLPKFAIDLESTFCNDYYWSRDNRNLLCTALRG